MQPLFVGKTNSAIDCLAVYENDAQGNVLLCHCEEQSDVAIRFPIMKSIGFQKELRIPTTSLRTGLGMTLDSIVFLNLKCAKF